MVSKRYEKDKLKKIEATYRHKFTVASYRVAFNAIEIRAYDIVKEAAHRRRLNDEILIVLGGLLHLR